MWPDGPYFRCRAKNRFTCVERFFSRIKRWRGIASRFDKYAVVYRDGIVLAAIVDWLKQT